MPLNKKASGRTLLAYTYDELGRKISQTDITGRQVRYRFDKSNHLVDICNEVDQSIVKFTRDVDGAIQKITHANGMWQDISYDADKNITSLTVATPDKILAQNTYRYDGNGQRIEKNELAGKTLYTYDSLNRLEQAEYPTYTERFSYDQAGNRLTRTAKDIEEQYVYDVNNRLTRRTVNGQVENYRYDNAGNLLQDGNNTYEYDAFRRTSKVTTKAGITQINRYDAEGLRCEMEENGKLVQFIFNENKEVITEQEGENITRLIRTSELWAMEANPEKTWYHYASDEQGSTVFITDEQGDVKNRYTYDAFGNTIEAEEQIPNRYQYTGQQLDPITQQYYLRARFYNPAIARFTQEDEYHGDGLNLYAYCANDPVDYYDPSGYYKNPWGLTAKDIPTSKNGGFDKFFNSLTPDELDELWKDKSIRKKIERNLRYPGGMHEWHMVSRTPTFKRWGLSAEDIKTMRTKISNVEFINPSGLHGKLGSTKAHNEILGIIDSSIDYNMFKRRLNNWSNYRLKGGVNSLP